MKKLTPNLLHKWYLEATKTLHPESYNKKAQVPYSQLSPEQKDIDIYIADKINGFFGSVTESKQKENSYEDELEIGKKTELEHAATIKRFMRPEVDVNEVAEEIAKDHLKELPDYYTRLKKMEKGSKSERLSKILESYEKIVKDKDFNDFLKVYRNKHPKDKIEDSMLKKLFDAEVKNPVRGLFYAASPLAYSMKVLWLDKFADLVHHRVVDKKHKEEDAGKQLRKEIA